MLEKLAASYHYVYNDYDEDKIFGKCWTAISSIENIEKEFGSDVNLGNISESGVANELWVQHGLLRECIEQLKNAESSRSTLVTHLRDALNEQELKVNQLQDELQVAQSRYDQLGRLLLGQAPPPPPLENNLDEIPPPPPASTYCETPPPPEFPPEHENGVHTTNEESRLEISGHNISYVFSLASEGVIGQSDASKRQRLNKNSSTSFSSVPCFLPQPQHPPPPPPPPILYSDSMYQPPSLPFRPPPLQPTAFSYGSPSFPVVGVPSFPSPYQYGPDGGYFGQPSYPPPFQ
ncbi:formin-like protein 20 [Asparagus officinalis]|nr:formin-like protein 20 [Asparagus officinalis]